MYENPSKDSLAIIEDSECRQDPRDLTAQRFRSCFNEIERLRATLDQIAKVASRKGPANEIQALRIIEGCARTVAAESRGQI